MKKLLLKLPLYLTLATLSLSSLQAMEVLKVDILKEQQAIAHMKVVTEPSTADERYPISDAYILKPTADLIAKIKIDPTYVPTKEERSALFVCLLTFDRINKDPINALKQTNHGIRVSENPNLLYVAQEAGVSAYVKARIIVYSSDVALAFDHLKKIFMAPAILALDTLAKEQKDLSQLKVVHNNPKAHERFPISEAFIIKPTLNLIEKMKQDKDYLPTPEQRKSLYICSLVFKNVEKNPDETLIKGSNLHENPNILYLKKSSDSFLRANLEISASLVQWAVEETNIRASKIQAKNQEAEWGSWCKTITDKVNAFFSLPYKDVHIFPGFAKGSKLIDGKNYDVERPNHALAHGLRSAFTAVDIIDAYASADPSSFHTENTQNFAKLIQEYVSSDPDFRKKVFMASAYQRTGRESEISGKESELAKKRYNAYVQKDSENFHEAVMNDPQVKQLFVSAAEVKAYTLAIYPNQAEKETLPENFQQLNTVVRAAIFTSHMVDLKRIANTGNTAFPLNGVKGSVAINIGGSVLVNKNGSDDWADWTFNEAGKFPAESKLLNKIWDREEAYLEATGDRSLKAPYFENKFFLQAQDPQNMANILLQTQKELNKKA